MKSRTIRVSRLDKIVVEPMEGFRAPFVDTTRFHREYEASDWQQFSGIGLTQGQARRLAEALLWAVQEGEAP